MTPLLIFCRNGVRFAHVAIGPNTLANARKVMRITVIQRDISGCIYVNVF